MIKNEALFVIHNFTVGIKKLLAELPCSIWEHFPSLTSNERLFLEQHLRLSRKRLGHTFIRVCMRSEVQTKAGVKNFDSGFHPIKVDKLRSSQNLVGDH